MPPKLSDGGGEGVCWDALIVAVVQEHHFTFAEIGRMTLPQLRGVTSQPEDIERAWRTKRMTPKARAIAKRIKAIYDTY